MAKIIGVVPASNIGEAEKSTMNDHYKLGNNYTKRVLEAGAIPVGVAPVDNWLPEEALKLFDGYIIQGGPEFYPYHFQIIHDAVINHKRYLGICLGSQLIYTYFVLRKMAEEQGCTGDVVKAICALREKNGPDFSVLKRVSGHRSTPAPRGSEDATKHNVTVVPGTILHRLTGKETLRAASFHDLHVPPDQSIVTINAWSANGDGVVEGVEYGDNLLGVQFHPEVDELLPEIFTFLTETEDTTRK